MSKADLAFVNPDILVWARERAGLSVDKVSRSLGIDRDTVDAWELGFVNPPFTKAEQLANLLRVPFGFFYLNTRPTLDIPIPDLRTLEEAEPNEPSVDFLDLLNDVLSKQEWYRDYAKEHGANALPFVSRFTTRASVLDVARDIRETVGTTNGFRDKARDWSDFLRLFSEAAESIGILVMRSGVVGNNTRRPLSKNEFQGFAIADKIAPLVFVNAQDFKAAQIFTLAHELAHIWTGASGISNPDETEIPTSKASIESFCNAVAAETLVPRAEFLELWHYASDERLVGSLARHFWVSTLVILRRARELNVLSVPRFMLLLELERSKQQATAKPSGGDYYRNVMARHGHRFTEAVVQDVRQGTTVFRDAARLLDMKVPALEKLVGRYS